MNYCNNLLKKWVNNNNMCPCNKADAKTHQAAMAAVAIQSLGQGAKGCKRVAEVPTGTKSPGLSIILRRTPLSRTAHRLIARPAMPGSTSKILSRIWSVLMSILMRMSGRDSQTSSISKQWSILNEMIAIFVTSILVAKWTSKTKRGSIATIADSRSASTAVKADALSPRLILNYSRFAICAIICSQICCLSKVLRTKLTVRRKLVKIWKLEQRCWSRRSKNLPYFRKNKLAFTKRGKKKCSRKSHIIWICWKSRKRKTSRSRKAMLIWKWDLKSLTK